MTASRLRWTAAAAAATLTLAVSVPAAAAPSASAPITTAPITTAPGAAAPVMSTPTSARTPADIAETQVALAAERGVQQSVAVIDRQTGALVASAGGDEVYNTESILKLFTAAYYLVQADGQPDADLTQALHSLIEVSDNDVQTSFWDYDIIPTIVERYGLSGTRNGPNASARTWGSDRTTADDQVRFLSAMDQDPLVGPFLLSTMAATEPEGTDGFDQRFGLNALAGVHGSKQGWSDPGWSPANLHSVGYTARYFVAILQTSPEASYATMRATSTSTARALAALDPPLAIRETPAEPTLWAQLLMPLSRWVAVLDDAADVSPADLPPADGNPTADGTS